MADAPKENCPEVALGDSCPKCGWVNGKSPAVHMVGPLPPQPPTLAEQIAAKEQELAELKAKQPVIESTVPPMDPVHHGDD